MSVRNCANVSACAVFFPTLSLDRTLILDNSAKPQIMLSAKCFFTSSKETSMVLSFHGDGYYHYSPLTTVLSWVFPSVEHFKHILHSHNAFFHLSWLPELWLRTGN